MPLSKIQGIEGQVTPNLGRRNLVINGDMRIAQRGTSQTGITSDGYKQAPDRFNLNVNGAGTWTASQSTTAPEGFVNSYKLECTTADASLASGDVIRFRYRMEGQDLQHLKKGTSNAESVTLSFYVRSSKTGTYIVELNDADNNRHIAKSYTITSADTWQFVSLTYAGDTTGALDNDNAHSLSIMFGLAAGSGFTSGTLATSWANKIAANRHVGQVNLADTVGNTFYLTGVQLEVGDTATDFEHRSFEEELRLCSRYYRKIGRHMGGAREGYSSSAVTFYPGMRLTGSGAANIVTTLTTGGVMYSRGGVNNSTGTLNGTVGISTGATDQAFTASFSHNGTSTGSTYNGTVSGFYVDGLTFGAEL